nr:winged helix-turn-helix domain-containing protein [Rudaeicoccus suwonensis]
MVVEDEPGIAEALVAAFRFRGWLADHAGTAAHAAEVVVELYVSYLRKKIDTDGVEPLIHTVRGAGYVLRPPV